MTSRKISTVFIGTLVCLGLAVSCASASLATASPISYPSAVASSAASEAFTAVGRNAAESVSVIADAAASKVTSTDGTGLVSATITQPGLATSPGNLPPESLGPAGNLIHEEGQKKLTTTTTDTTIQTRAVENGMQTIIVIDSAKAANDVSFQIHVANGLTAMAKPNGAIDYMDANGVAVAGLAAPWAVDSNGNNIATSLTLSGNTLTQHIDFNENTAFPVIADPQWWQMGISAAAGAAVGAAVVVGIPGVGPTIGGIVGGCVVGALNAMWDGADFWGGFWGCATGAALGAVAGMVGSIVKNVLGARGIGV